MNRLSLSRCGMSVCVAAILLAGCDGSKIGVPQAEAPALPSAAHTLNALPTPIQHVIIIFQENRTPDYLFQGLRGADISRTGIDSRGEVVPLHRVSLKAGYDLLHGHDAFVADYDGGKVDGFDKGLPRAEHLEPFGYAPMSEVRPYHDMAAQYVFGDHMFQSNQGPSFPAHQYIISGRATDPSLKPYVVSGNPRGVMPRGRGAGCDGPPASNVTTIDLRNGLAGPSPFPCFDPLVLSDLLDSKSVPWRYYQDSAGAGVWHAYDAVRHVRYGVDYADVRWPSTAVLTDLSNGDLAGVTWVMPARPWSDHAGRGSTTKGPSWVAPIVNAIGESQFWNSSAIFVTWDDWGGWYDHVKPPIHNYYELGFRVPLIVISPYAKRRYVSKKQHEFGSILAFTEETFGIQKGALGSTDRRADDLRDAFDFSQKPRTFVPIKAPPFNGAIGKYANDEDP